MRNVTALLLSVAAWDAMPTCDVADLAIAHPYADVGGVSPPAAFDSLMSEFGFAFLTPACVDDSVVDDLWAASAAYFAGGGKQPAETYGGGYHPPGAEAVGLSFDASTVQDPLESLYIAGHLLGELLPVAGADAALNQAVARYWLSMQAVLSALMELAGIALAEDPGYFAPHFEAPQACTQCQLKLSHYNPPWSSHGLDYRLRYQTHTDFAGFTLLSIEDPGLRAMARSGQWLDVDPTSRYALVVNVGDLIGEWSDGRWWSPPHHVVAGAERFAVPFFTGPVADTVVGNTTAGAHLQHKLDLIALRRSV